MKSKLKFIVPILLIAVGGVYKFVLAKPGAPAPKPKVDGQVYVLPKEFLINLNGGRFAKLSVGLVLDHTQAIVAEGGHEAGGLRHAAAGGRDPRPRHGRADRRLGRQSRVRARPREAQVSAPRVDQEEDRRQGRGDPVH
jgi:hypothetical protein